MKAESDDHNRTTATLATLSVGHLFVGKNFFWGTFRRDAIFLSSAKKFVGEMFPVENFQTEAVQPPPPGSCHPCRLALGLVGWQLPQWRGLELPSWGGLMG